MKYQDGSTFQVRVARVWLDMGVRMKAFREAKRKDWNLWDEHKRIVIGHFQANRYRDRLSFLALEAVKHHADVLVFPACTVVHHGNLDLKKLLGYTPRILVSGALALSRTRCREYAVVVDSGRVIERFDASHALWCDAGPFSMMAAICREFAAICYFSQNFSFGPSNVVIRSLSMSRPTSI